MHSSQEKVETIPSESILQHGVSPVDATTEVTFRNFSNTDEKIEISIESSQGKVILGFNKAVQFIALSPKEVRALAEQLRKQSYLV